MYSGFYNLSATIPHMKTTESAIHMMKEIFKFTSIEKSSKIVETNIIENLTLFHESIKVLFR